MPTIEAAKKENVVQVAQPPLKPVLVYDGDCNFCKYWISRWRRIGGDAWDFVPLQDPLLKTRFPEIPRQEFEKAVHFIDFNGAIYSGAEAVFRALAKNSRWQWLLRLYERSRFFAGCSEFVYHFVSRHRSFLSWLWGTQPPVMGS